MAHGATTAAEAALDYFETAVALAALRLERRARAGDAAAQVEADRQIGALRQRLLRAEADRPDLPIHALRRYAPLSERELDVLWLVIASRVEARVSDLAVTITNDKQRHWVSPALCLEVLYETRRERLGALALFADDGTLARSGLVQLIARTQGAPNGLHDVLLPASFLPSFLAGRRSVSEVAAPYASRVPPGLTLAMVALRAEDREELARAAALAPFEETVLDPRLGQAGYDFQRGALLVLAGPRGSGKSLVARALAGEARRAALVCDTETLAGRSTDEIEAVLSALCVEAAVTGDWVVLDGADRLLRDAPGESSGAADRQVWARLRALLQRLAIVCVVTTESAGHVAIGLRDRAFFQLELPPLGREQAAHAWEVNRPLRFVPDADVDFRAIAQRHALSGRGIQAAINLALRAREGVVSAATLDAACLAQQNTGMSDVAVRSWVHRQRTDLELSDGLSRQIDEIIATERIRDRVLDTWGLARKMHKGLGLVCLFDGEPGTGKTLACEVIASELGLPLFAVNVANVVSKWVGETEKNLQRIFDDAARNRCVLLFDEADALFSKRFNVERSTDRYSNMEIGLLLQLVENHRGLVLLTTNLKDAIDPAFARRFAFKLTFEFPDALVRERIWKNLLPADHLADDVDVAALGEYYDLSGGGIRTVVLRAAYRAGVAGRSIDQAILEDCALAECKALGKLVRTGSGGF